MRTSKSTLVKWLLEHPDVWTGYPKPIEPPGTETHSQKIWTDMQNAGLFAHKSACNALTVVCLVEAARAASAISGTNNGTEMIKP